MNDRDKKYMRQVLTTIANYNGTDLLFDKKFLELQDNFELKFIEVDKDTIRVMSVMKKEK